MTELFSGFERVVLAVLTVAFLLFLIELRTSPIRTRGKWLIVFIRLGIVGGLCTILINPQRVVKKFYGQKEDFVFLIDASKSVLSYYDAEKKFKTAVADLLDSSWVANLQKRFNLRYYLVGATPRLILPQDLAAGNFQLSSSSSIVKSIRHLSDEFQKHKSHPAGMVLWSDGQDTDQNRVPLNRILNQIGYPINTLSYQLNKPIKDLSVHEVVVDPVYFSGVRGSITVKVKNIGFESFSIPVSLLAGQKVISTQEIQIKSGTEIHEIVFNFLPDREGQVFYHIELPVVHEEINSINNQKHFKVYVRKNSIKTLHVSGSPSWDTKFLRMALKQDPTIDLVSFYILREHEDDNTIPSSELSLIQFPYDRLFNEEVRNFDLIFLQNFKLKKFLIPYFYINNIGDYLKSGGKLIIIGGPKALVKSDVSGTTLENAMPFELKSSSWLAKRFHIEITEDGKNSILLNNFLKASPTFLSDIKQRVPFFGINQVGKRSPGANILMEAVTDDAQRYPIMVSYQAGEGMLLAILTNSFWKLRYTNNQQRGVGYSYQQFIKNMIEWQLSYETFQPVRVAVAAEKTASQTILSYQFVNNIEGFLQNHCPCELVSDIMKKEYSVPIESNSHERTVQVKIDNLIAGEYAVNYKIKTSKGEVFPGKDYFYVYQEDKENLYPYPAVEWMQKVAELTGGKHLVFGQFEKLLAGPADQIALGGGSFKQIQKQETYSIWDRFWFFLVLLALLCWDWSVRKWYEP